MGTGTLGNCKSQRTKGLGSGSLVRRHIPPRLTLSVRPRTILADSTGSAEAAVTSSSIRRENRGCCLISGISDMADVLECCTNHFSLTFSCFAHVLLQDY